MVNTIIKNYAVYIYIAFLFFLNGNCAQFMEATGQEKAEDDTEIALLAVAAENLSGTTGTTGTTGSTIQFLGSCISEDWDSGFGWTTTCSQTFSDNTDPSYISMMTSMLESMCVTQGTLYVKRTWSTAAKCPLSVTHTETFASEPVPPFQTPTLDTAVFTGVCTVAGIDLMETVYYADPSNPGSGDGTTYCSLIGGTWSVTYDPAL